MSIALDIVIVCTCPYQRCVMRLQHFPSNNV